jgi:transposase-like protein
MLCPICYGETRKFGRNGSGSQRYRCDPCEKCFTDESTLAIDRRCVSPEKMATCLRLLLEGNSVRSLERVFKVGRNTIIATMVAAGEACKRFLEAKIVGLPVADVQCDEVWGFVGCKEKTRLRLNRPEDVGHVWCFTAIERTTKLLLAYRVGKRTRPTPLSSRRISPARRVDGSS